MKVTQILTRLAPATNSMKKILSIFFFSVLLCTSLRGQTVLLNVDREHEKVPDGGPNTEKFVYGYFSFGFAAPPDQAGSRVVFENSINTALGLRKKFRISGFYSLGWEASISFSDWKMKQTDGKTYPDTIKEDVQRFDVTDFSMGFFNRFNFDVHRGNNLGSYLDLGVTGKWAFAMTEVHKQDSPRGKATTRIDELNYTNVFQANFFARLGSGRWALWAAYRPTNFFIKKANYNELPRASAGIDIGLF